MSTSPSTWHPVDWRHTRVTSSVCARNAAGRTGLFTKINGKPSVTSHYYWTAGV